MDFGYPWLPPALSCLSVCLFLALCSHCQALPDGRCLGRERSVNCKGMQAEITDVSWDFKMQFLLFSSLASGASASGYTHI